MRVIGIDRDCQSVGIVENGDSIGVDFVISGPCWFGITQAALTFIIA